MDLGIDQPALEHPFLDLTSLVFLRHENEYTPWIHSGLLTSCFSLLYKELNMIEWKSSECVCMSMWESEKAASVYEYAWKRESGILETWKWVHSLDTHWTFDSMSSYYTKS